MTNLSAQLHPSRTLGARDLLVATALAAMAIGIMFDAWLDIARMGLFKEEMSYVLLAPFVVGWVAIARRNRLANCPVRREWAGLGIVAGGWLIYWYGYLADPVLWRAGAVVVAVGAFVSAIGLDALLRLLPAFAATIFLVPI